MRPVIREIEKSWHKLGGQRSTLLVGRGGDVRAYIKATFTEQALLDSQEAPTCVNHQKFPLLFTNGVLTDEVVTHFIRQYKQNNPVVV